MTTATVRVPDALSGEILALLSPSLSPTDLVERIAVQAQARLGGEGAVVSVESDDEDTATAMVGRTSDSTSRCEAPLKVDDRVIGSITVFRDHPFSPDDRLALMTVALVAAAAVHGAQLREGARQQAQELQLLRRVNASVSATLDLDTVLDTIAASAVELIGVPRCAVYELDSRDEQLHCRATRGHHGDRPITAMKLGHGVAGTAAWRRQPVWMEDTSRDVMPGFEDVVDEGGTYRELILRLGFRAVLAVPMIHHGAVIGAVSVVWAEPHRVRPREVRLLTALAQQAAIAFDHARLHAAAVQRGDTLDALLRATHTVMAGLEVGVTLEGICEEASRIAGTSHINVYLVDRAAGVVRVAASRGLCLPVGHERPLGVGLSGMVAMTGQALYVADTQHDPRNAFAERDRELGIRSYLALPIKIRGEVLGVIAFNMTDPRQFTEDQLGYLGSFADQAAIALENSRLYREARLQAQRMRALADLSGLLSETLDPAAVAHRIVDSVREFLRARNAVLYRVSTGAQQLEALGAAGDIGPMAELLASLPDGGGLCGLAVRTRQAIATADLLDDPRLAVSSASREQIHRAGYRAVLAVPLVTKERVIGVLCLTDRLGRVFEDEDVRLAQAFAAHAAIALANAEVYEDLSRAHQAAEKRSLEIESLNAVSTTITSTLELSEVLDRIADSAVRLIAADWSSVYEFDALEGILHPHARPGHPGWASVRLGQGAAGTAALRGEPFFSPDIQSEPPPGYDAPIPGSERLLSSIASMEAFRAILAVPLVSRGTIRGALCLYWKAVHAYDGSEVHRLTALAQHAAVAIENARLLEDLKSRQARLESLLEISRQLSRIQPVEQLLQEIAEACGRLVGSASAGVRLVHGDDLVAVAAVGEEPESPGGPRLPANDSLSGLVARTGQPKIVDMTDPDVLMPAAVRDAMRRSGYRTWLGVPIKVGDRVIGVLTLRTPSAHGFSGHDVEIATAFASQAAAALDNARLYEELSRAHQAAEKRSLEIEQLHEVSTTITSTLELSEVLDRIAESAVQLIGADWSAVYELDARDRMLLPRARVGIPGSVRLHLGQGAAGTAALRAEPFFSADVRIDPPPGYDKPFPDDEQTPSQKTAGQFRAILSVPIISRRTVRGAFCVYWKDVHTYDEREMRRATGLAQQAAIALENARLYEETRRTLAELRARNEELDSFVYSVSHDLRSPLRAIDGMASILIEETAHVESGGRRYLERIQGNVAQMERLIADVLAVARIGREARAPELVDVGPLVEDLLLGLSGPIRQKGITVVVGELGRVLAVRSQIEQVFANLLANAVKYIGDGAAPRIEIGAVETAEHVEFFVKDTGIGIDPAYHARVFELFHRLQDVEAEGTGVGLAIVKKVVEGVGGRIGVDSVKGGGATFRFTWPRGTGR